MPLTYKVFRLLKHGYTFWRCSVITPQLKWVPSFPPTSLPRRRFVRRGLAGGGLSERVDSKSRFICMSASQRAVHDRLGRSVVVCGILWQEVDVDLLSPAHKALIGGSFFNFFIGSTAVRLDIRCFGRESVSSVFKPHAASLLFFFFLRIYSNI